MVSFATNFCTPLCSDAAVFLRSELFIDTGRLPDQRNQVNVFFLKNVREKLGNLISSIDNQGNVWGNCSSKLDFLIY